MKIVLGSSINIVDYSPEEERKIKELFSIFNPRYAKAKARGVSTWNIPQRYFYCYKNGNRIICPSGISHILKQEFSEVEIKEDRRKFEKNPEITLKEKIVPREWQKEAAKKSAPYECGVFKIPTAGGKTIFGIILAASYQTNTLIICDSKTIFGQWVDSVKKFFHMDAGIISGNKLKIGPITIAMSQTLANRREEVYPYRDYFGMVIVDECQMIGPSNTTGMKSASDSHEVYNKMGRVVQWFTAKRKYGLSDSAIRSDGQTVCVHFSLGPIIHEVEFDSLEEEGLVVKPELIVRPTEFQCPSRIEDISEQYVEVITALTRDEKRMNLIIQDLLMEQDHFNLILANSRFYVRMLAGALIERNPSLAPKICVLTSSTPDLLRTDYIQKMRDGELNYLFATSLADKGMDIPILDRLYLTFPGKFEGSAKQRLGRVVRSSFSKDGAKLYDYADILEPIFRNQFRNRMRDVYFERTKYNSEEEIIKKLKIFKKDDILNTKKK